MSERKHVWVLRDPTGELVYDLGYDRLGIFIPQRFDESLPDCHMRLPGVRGTGPADCPLDLRQMGRHNRHRLVVLARVHGHRNSRSRRTKGVKACGVL